MRQIYTILLFVIVILVPTEARTSESILDAVRNRGYVKCAIGNRPVGDTRIGESGYEGFFPEFCQVVALAVFGNRQAVEMTPTLIRYGLNSISDGEVDIYVSNVTWTFSRDLSLNLTPAAVLYYDGQGFLSHRGAVDGKLSQLREATVCVSHSTTSIDNLEEFIEKQNLDWRILSFASSEGRNDAFFSRRCDLLTTDRLALATLRATAVDSAEEYTLHEEIISKEPLVAYVNSSDMRWRNIVRWSFLVTVLAEEKGITKNNYTEYMESPDPEIRRLLGVDPTTGTEAAGLAEDWTLSIIANAGNYGEIFERYLGKESAFKIDRGVNRLWRDGGLLYSPPFR